MLNDKLNVAIIASVYNEKDGLIQFWNALKLEISKLKDFSFQVIFVNDGSRDNSQEIINKIVNQNNPDIVIHSIEFSRNFGHEAAMLAGIDNVKSDIIICLDSDLQHPPSMIVEMINEFKRGSDIILMNRKKRLDNGFIKKTFSYFFYKIMDFLSTQKFEQNASDFFLISNKVADIIRNNFREKNRFLRGFIQVIGFKLSTVDYEAPVRIAGESSYSFKSLFKLGFTAIFAFSNKPLKISLLFSFMFFLFSVSIIIYSLQMYFFGTTTPPSGYTTIIIFQSIGFTVISFLISVLSIYFGKSLDEIRDRPIYLVKNIKDNK